MSPRFRLLALLCLPLFLSSMAAPAQPSDAVTADASLQYVVMLSRHGVRSPIGDLAAIDKYSAAPWPKWEVPPSYLTPHGYQLMKIFGAWDRAHFSAQGLFAASGCAEAPRVTILADTDQRTRETGKALAEGMFPGCAIEVQAQPEGTVDPLFRGMETGHGNGALVAAAILGRIGGDPNRLSEAFHPQLAALDRVLAGCGKAPGTNPSRTSLFDVSFTVAQGAGYSGAMRSPLSVGSTLAENLLLEYTDGMKDVGWGCVDGQSLRALMQIDTAGWEYGYRTRTVAQMYASDLLDRILQSIHQSVTGQPVDGALGKPGDRLLILVGHDTNIVTVAGALGIDWIVDGRVDDTPPGGVLLFELWRPRHGGQPFVKLEYTAQTLEQMREAQPLSQVNPPAAAPVFIPACSGSDISCTWDGFATAMRAAIAPQFIHSKP